MIDKWQMPVQFRSKIFPLDCTTPMSDRTLPLLPFFLHFPLPDDFLLNQASNFLMQMHMKSAGFCRKVKPSERSQILLHVQGTPITSSQIIQWCFILDTFMASLHLLKIALLRWSNFYLLPNMPHKDSLTFISPGLMVIGLRLDPAYFN